MSTLLLLLALLLPAPRPVSRFTYTCDPAPALNCTFTSSSLGNPSVLAWDWNDGRLDVRTVLPNDSSWKTISNTWAAPGSYRVRLTVTDSSGGVSYSTQSITLPAGQSACTCVDTVVVHDIVHDTVQPPPVAVPPVVVTPPLDQAPSGETWAELPRVYLDTKMPATSGATIMVPAGGDLQAALNKAQPGDAITLANGATFSGNFILPTKAGASWITIRPASMTNVPPEGTRMSPAIAAAANLPKILSTSNMGAFATADGAHHFRLIALEVSVPASIANTGLLRFGSSYETTLAQLPHDLVLDRMYVHGTATGNNRRCVSLNGASTAVIDSYIADCHEQGADAQAIAGWSGPGPFKIVNNYLEASGENVMFGGGDPLIQGLIPSDIEIRRNHVVKPRSWVGGPWLVKNLFEIKNAQRVLVEGNVFDGNWANGQGGSAIVLKSVNQGGKCTWCVAADITFRLNVVRNTGAGFALTGRDVGTQAVMSRVTITDNIVTGINAVPFSGDGRGFLINNNPADLVIGHNTVLDATNSAITFGGPATEPPTRLTFRENLIDVGQYGVKGPGLNTPNTLLAFLPGGFTRNLLITDPAYASAYPAGTLFAPNRAALGFTSDLLLSPTSKYRAATGRDPGANVGAVLAAIAGVVQP